MTSINTNDVFLSLGGLDVSAIYTDEIVFDQTNDLVESTAGAGQATKQRLSGLNDYTLKLGLVHDDATRTTAMAKIKPGDEFAVIYGPSGNATGEPKFACNMRVSAISGPNAGIQKPLQKFEVTFMASDTPTARPVDGDTF